MSICPNNPGPKKMGRTYLSKIPTFSSNPHTIMLLLIVGEFGYPEVIQYTTGWSVYNEIHIQYRAGQVHNPNIGLHTRAGQPAAMDTQDWPVSQRWIQYTTGRSVYNEIHIQYRAGQSNSNGPTTSTGQSNRDGKCHIWPVH